MCDWCGHESRTTGANDTSASLRPPQSPPSRVPNHPLHGVFASVRADERSVQGIRPLASPRAVVEHRSAGVSVGLADFTMAPVRLGDVKGDSSASNRPLHTFGSRSRPSVYLLQQIVNLASGAKGRPNTKRHTKGVADRGIAVLPRGHGTPRDQIMGASVRYGTHIQCATQT